MKCNTCGTMNCMEHGGDVEPMDSSVDDELNGMCCDEFWDASEKKDKKGMLDALRAIVLGMKE